MKHKSMLKKLIFRLALVLGLFFGTAVVCSFAESYTDVNGINYNLNNTTNPPTASVGDNTGFYGSEIIIPPNITISGTRYVVTSVEDNAFKGCTSLTSVTIPEGVTSIGKYAFYGCTSLTSVTIPEGVTSIGKYAFYGCTSLTSVTIPEGVTLIGSCAFYGCTSLTSVTIPEGVTSIGNYAFNGCTSLTRVTIPEGVTSIGKYAFEGCTSLTRVTIPSSVTSIEIGAFNGCSSLTSLTILNSGTSITYEAFSNCSNLLNVYIKDGSIGFNLSGVGIQETANAWRYTVLPGDKQTIPGKTLVQITSVKKVDGTASEATSITCGAMGGYYIIKEKGEDSSLTSVKYEHSHDTITNENQGTTFNTTENGIKWTCEFIDNNKNVSIKSVDSSTISGDVVIPSVVTCQGYTVTSIGYGAFYNCSGLTSVTIPNSITSIGGDAFNGCDNLIYTEENNAYYLGNSDNRNYALIKVISTDITSYTIKENTKIVAEDAFANCRNLTSIDIPASIERLNGNPFRNCSFLTSINVNTGNENFVSYDGIVYSKDYKTLYIYPAGKTDISFTIPSEVENIGDYAFNGCDNLRNVTIPNSVTSIGYYSFRNCINLKYTEENLARYLGNSYNPHYALIGVFSPITCYTINENTKVVAGDAFAYCSSLTDVYAKGENEDELDLSNTNIRSEVDIWRYMVAEDQTRVAAGKTLVKITSVAKANGSASYANSITCGDMGNQYIVSEDVPEGFTFLHSCGMPTDENQGTTFNTTENGIEWTCEFIDNNKNVSIKPANSSTISGDVVIPSAVTCQGYTVTSIGIGAFEGCSGLTSVTISEGVTSIGNSAFYDCSGLTSVTIPEGVTSIGEYAFGACGLTSVTIPSSVTSIDGGAFEGCSGLTSVTISEGVKLVGAFAFYNCSSLTSVIIPNSVTEILNNAFDGCENLINIYVKDELYVISYEGMNDKTNIWRYTVLPEEQTIQGKILVQITSVAKVGETTTDPLPTSITCGAMGDQYVIEGKDEDQSLANVTFSHSCGMPTDENQGTTFNTTENGIEWTCEFIDNNKNVSIKPADTSIISENVVIPSVVTCQGYTVTSIENNAFKDYSNLTSITIPEGVTSIGAFAFKNCRNLTSVTIPNSVTSIGEDAFICTSLTDVYVKDGLDVSGAGIQDSANIWRYAVLPEEEQTIQGKTLVQIPSVTKGDGSAISGSISLSSTDIGDKYLVEEVECCATGDKTNGWTVYGTHDYRTLNYSWTEENGSWKCTSTKSCQREGCNVTEVETMTITPYNGTYDGNEHSSVANISGEISGATISYSTDNSTWNSEVPKCTEVGTYTIYVKVQNNEDERIFGTQQMVVTIKEYEPGDINKSGEVDVIDLQMLYNHVTENSVITDEEQLKLANINNDSYIDVLDLQALFNIIANS